jgi:aspartate racemase
VAIALRDVGVTNTTIGVMGTKATVELGLYQDRLGKSGWNCIVPTAEETDNLVQPAIDLIKSGDVSKAHSMFITVIDSLIARGAQSVVLGCTEIPLVVREDNRNGIPLINSIDSLVKVAIVEYSRP